MTEQQQNDKHKACLYNLGFGRDQADSLIDAFHFRAGGTAAILIRNLKVSEDLALDLSFKNTGSDSGYELESIRALLHTPTTIAQGIIFNLDTIELEQQMQKLDWSFDYRKLENDLDDWTKRDDRYWQYASAIYNLVMVSANEPMGKAISDELKLRHWLATPYEERFLSQALREGNSRAAVFNYSEGKGFTLPQVRNYLEGRAVFCNVDLQKVNQKKWLRYSFREASSQNVNGPLEKGQKQPGCPDYNLAAVLSRLPVIYGPSLSQQQLLHDLQQGDLKEVTILHNEKVLPFKITAAPERKSIDMFDAQGKRVNESLFKIGQKKLQPKNKKKGHHP